MEITDERDTPYPLENLPTIKRREKHLPRKETEMFKANRRKDGSGNWIGSTDIWNDPRAQIAPEPTAIEPSGFAFPSIPPADTRPASPAQLKFMKDLFAQRSNNPQARALRIGALSVYKDGRLSVTAACDFITAIKRIPRDR